ncbi:MAG: hypothetical protein ACMXX5_00170 [Candidatus Woesearchaeota archaeon]
MLMLKKSQITIFIILFILLLLLFAFSFFYVENLYAQSESAVIASPDKVLLRSYITSCIDLNARQVFYDFGMQGGTFNQSKPMLVLNYNDDITNITFLYDKGDFRLPPLKKWEEILSSKINYKIKDCIFQDEIKHYDLNYLEPESFVEFQGNQTFLTVFWPVVLNMDSLSYDILEPYVFSYSINFIHIYDDVFDILALNYFNPNSIEFANLVYLNTSLYLNAIDNIIIYTLFDPSSSLDNRPYQFNFASRFNHSWVPSDE